MNEHMKSYKLTYWTSLSPRMKTDSPRMIGSNLSPDMLASQCTPRARPPATNVAIALFNPLYIHPPAIYIYIYIYVVS